MTRRAVSAAVLPVRYVNTDPHEIPPLRLNRPPPWGDEFHDRWGFRRSDEPIVRRTFPARDIRYVLARVNWWKTRHRRSGKWRRCPLPPLKLIDRQAVRGLLRRHGLPAPQLLREILADIRADQAAQSDFKVAQLAREAAEKQAELARRAVEKQAELVREAAEKQAELAREQAELAWSRVFAARERRMRVIREKQRRSREWISFEDIADWCARETGSIKPDEARRTHAYAELRNSLMAGDFEADGRCRVLLLNPFTRLVKLTRERLTTFEEIHDADTVRSEFIAKCLMPRDLCKIWFETKRISLPVWLYPATPPRSGGAALSGGAKKAPDRWPGLPPDKARNPVVAEAFTAMCQYAEEEVATRGKPPKRDDTAHAISKMTGYPVRKARALYPFLPRHLRNPSRAAPK